ncbi:hypothetical protein [Gracilibacillus sp. JCM 18860]|uniref:hypothetical protein n=1 Tax=Gracilibacillus sp. JCM 18860 TaxID=1306159 RepID=UPI003260A3F0
MLHNKYVENYIKKWKCGKLLLNIKRIQLIGLIEKHILPRDDLYYFDEEQIENYIEFSETWYFELDEWEKFIAPPFIFYFEKKMMKLSLMSLLSTWDEVEGRMVSSPH